jgi:hypothetical protein
MNDCGLNSAQLERFDEQGFLLLPGMLDPVQDLDPILAEYAGVLDRLAHTLYTQGKVSSPYPELPFGERVSRMYEESGEMLNHWFDFHLPQRHVTHDTPLWVGPAVFRTLVNPTLLDAVESVIGGEIYSNPVQHVRIKPPESELPRNQQGKPVIGATQWHQDHGVVTPDADETNMLTVWFSLYDTPIEAGPLKVVPGSHKGGLRAHCANYRGHGGREIPEKLFEVERTRPLPTARGDMICLHRQTVHGSLANVGDKIRWSFDLRYNPIGQHTGREAFPGFVARSRKAPHLELRDADRWRRDWQDTRHKMARINRGGQTDVPFGRWADGHPDCA